MAVAKAVVAVLVPILASVAHAQPWLMGASNPSNAGAPPYNGMPIGTGPGMPMMGMMNMSPETMCWHGLTPASGENPLSCSHYESIAPGTTDCIYATVRQVVGQALQANPANAGSLLRLHFHDCFVNGCDGSVLLDSSYGQPKGNAEKDAPPNLTLEALDIIDEVKAAIDATCSPDVSCADILAIVAGVVVGNRGGPPYPVPLGRLDGCTSQKDAAPHYLPSAQATVHNVYNGASHNLKDAFAVQGLDLGDLVALSGAHTIGQAHCANFKDRIAYGGQKTPVPMNPGLRARLVQCCVHNKPGTCTGNMTAHSPDGTPEVDLEVGNPTQSTAYPTTGGGLTFDNSYFRNIQQRMALLTSDQALYSDPITAQLVDQFASDQMAFFMAFVRAMVRMGNILPSNMGVTPGAGMQLCTAATPGDSYGTMGAQYGYGSGQSGKGKAAPMPQCLAYKSNTFGIRKGKCTVAAASCKH